MARTIHHRDIRVKDFYAAARIGDSAGGEENVRMKLRIAKIRNERAPRVTQAELGDAVGVGQNSISRIERGEQQPTVQTLEKIAAYLDVEFIDLFEEYNRSEVEQELRGLLNQMDNQQLLSVLAFANVICERHAS